MQYPIPAKDYSHLGWRLPRPMAWLVVEHGAESQVTLDLGRNELAGLSRSFAQKAVHLNLRSCAGFWEHICQHG